MTKCGVEVDELRGQQCSDSDQERPSSDASTDQRTEHPRDDGEDGPIRDADYDVASGEGVVQPEQLVEGNGTEQEHREHQGAELAGSVSAGHRQHSRDDGDHEETGASEDGDEARMTNVAQVVEVRRGTVEAAAPQPAAER